MTTTHTAKKQWTIDSPDFEHYTIKEGNETVCTIYRGIVDQDEEDKAKENAKLIETAPKLLETLKDLLAAYKKSYTNLTGGDLSNAITVIAEGVIKDATNQ